MHTYAMTITQKSNQFHGSLRKVNRPTQKPLARILMRDSKVYIPVNVYLRQYKTNKLLSHDCNIGNSNNVGTVCEIIEKIVDDAVALT